MRFPDTPTLFNIGHVLIIIKYLHNFNEKNQAKNKKVNSEVCYENFEALTIHCFITCYYFYRFIFYFKIEDHLTW